MAVWWGFRRFSDLPARLGEAPLWSAAEERVWWIDIEGAQLLASDGDGGRTDAWPAPGPIGCLALLADGDLLAGVGTGLYRFDRRSGRFRERGRLDTTAPIRFNDGAVDAAGRFWVGAMDRDNRAPLGGIYRIGKDLVPVRVVEGLLTPNGLAVDGVRGRLYFSDSHASVRTVWACDCDLASGAVGERRVFARFGEADGRPDGAALDAEGNYWIAATDVGRLLCFAPDGRLRERIAVPVSHPTKPAFGGRDLATLFLTSRRVPPAGTQDRDSGFLLIAGVPRSGRLESLFRCRQEK
ncbi:gluconolactonase [Tistlia consotensis]|uniref:Gluconolactonase n=1 Tax=Tistlia consotensis USBA 355 TaxID=560819 RepID=A0A1Y6CMC5_9PROT|nr:SMP-30/gluconolactonase/LRE family protein [Tistlia consotensis]SMF76520.1 gluconolactonase [Tistlia consotensis USBA 355]SNS13149.1 gluconolactonase [Tistlia consotensis]